MAQIKVKDGKVHCVKCGRNVAVREEKGDAGRGQKPFVLVDDQGHVIAERYTSAGPGTVPHDGAHLLGDDS